MSTKNLFLWSEMYYVAMWELCGNLNKALDEVWMRFVNLQLQIPHDFEGKNNLITGDMLAKQSLANRPILNSSKVPGTFLYRWAF